jgi:two-component system, NarL family, nitrate/nitrite response regulator NarL
LPVLGASPVALDIRGAPRTWVMMWVELDLHRARDDDRQRRATSDSVRAYIVSSVRVYREALKDSLRNAGRIVVVGAGSPSEATLLEITSTRAQLVLIDFSPPRSLMIATAMMECPTSPKVIAVGVVDSDEQVLECAEAGLSGYIPCDASIEDLERVMCETMDDKFVCSPRITAALVRKIARLSGKSGPAPSVLVSHLTARQKQVATLLGQGLTNKEIGKSLSICSTTVRNHLHAIFEKLNVKRRAEAVAVLHVNGSGLTVRRAVSTTAISIL